MYSNDTTDGSINSMAAVFCVLERDGKKYEENFGNY